MKALTYHGPHHVRVDNVPDPGIEQPDDIILRVTATAICGSDLHLYRGKIPKVQHGDIFGHEFMGEVVECGSEVKNVQKGDRVVIPFVIACGDCFFCQMQQYAACENTNRGQGAALNKSKFPPLPRCLATAIFTAACRADRRSMCASRKATWGRLKCLNCCLTTKRFSCQIFCLPPRQAAKNAQIQRGSSVAVFGAGPVGLLTIACARLLGAEQIFVVDHHPYRLRFARGALRRDPD